MRRCHTCAECKYHLWEHWSDKHICLVRNSEFLVKPSHVPQCGHFKPKPEYIPKRGA